MINPEIRGFLDDLAHLLAVSYLREREERERRKALVRAYYQRMKLEAEGE